MAFLLWAIFTLNALAMHFFWYWTYWWFDIPMHFLGGVWLGGMTILALRRFMPEKFEKKAFVYMAAVGMALFIGGLWEVFEFSLDTFVTMRVNDIVDTICDFGMDIAGALSVAVLLIGKSKH